MEKVIHTLPFLVTTEDDLLLVARCFQSLAASCPQGFVVLYNQGGLTNEELGKFLQKFNLQFFILGDGINIGIAQGRMACFQYIWSHFPDCPYISEIHVDMFFPKGWLEGLINFLIANEDEPMICPGILTSQGELHPEQKEKTVITDIPLDNPEKMHNLLNNLVTDRVLEGFVHPVLHRAEVLKAVGGYDTDFLRGKQGYEDDSLLLGYRYYQGLKNDWKPKCYTKVRVYHATLAQRLTLTGIKRDFEINLQGLIYQYGVQGLRELSRIYNENRHFQAVIEQIMAQLK